MILVEWGGLCSQGRVDGWEAVIREVTERTWDRFNFCKTSLSRGSAPTQSGGEGIGEKIQWDGSVQESEEDVGKQEWYYQRSEKETE